jgi:hypothetical protein
MKEYALIYFGVLGCNCRAHNLVKGWALRRAGCVAGQVT